MGDGVYEKFRIAWGSYLQLTQNVSIS